MVKWNRVSFWKKLLAPYHKGIEVAIENGDEAKVDKLFESLNRWQKVMFREFDSWHMTESETMAMRSLALRRKIWSIYLFKVRICAN